MERPKKWETLKEEDLMKTIHEHIDDDSKYQQLKEQVIKFLNKYSETRDLNEETPESIAHAFKDDPSTQGQFQEFCDFLQTLFDKNGMFQISSDY